MLNNFGPVFKTYLTNVNYCIQKDGQLKMNEIRFKAIERKETHIKAKYKAFANFGTTKSNAKLQEATQKR